MKKYRVEYKATIEGVAYVYAEKLSEAKKIVRRGLEPTYNFMVNDKLSSREHYDLKGEIYREEDGR